MWRVWVGRRCDGWAEADALYLIDRVDELEPGRSVRARKLTSLSEEYWEPDGDELAMPAPFVLEALCQAATWLIMITTERRKRAALLSIGSVDWARPVRPGEVLVMSGEIDSFGEETAVVSGRVTVDDEVVLLQARGDHVRADRRRHARRASTTPSGCRTC